MSNQITIDGTSATGKSTVARKVAQKTGFYYINSGYIFRSIALLAIEENVEQIDLLKKWIDSLELKFSNKKIFIRDKIFQNTEINSLEVSQKTAMIAQHDFIRTKVDKFIISISESTDIVIDGRSSGVFLFPNSNNKFFLTCDINIRAERRLLELGLSRDNLREVILSLEKRDMSDYERKVQPMQIAKDAICINTSHLTIDEVVNTIICHLKLR